MSPAPVLEVHSLSKAFRIKWGLASMLEEKFLRFRRPPNQNFVFQDVTFAIYPGECMTLAGPNGTGKSTLLKCISGLMGVNGGKVLCHGKMIAQLTHGYGPYEDLSVWRNLLLAQQLLGASAAAAETNLEKMAALCGLQDRMLSLTSQLSEGMRAKIGLAALMCADFNLALLDECLNHVDAAFRDLFFDFTRTALSQDRSFVLTSHDEMLLKRFGTRFFKIENRALIELK